MSWAFVVVGVAGIASMRAAMEKGDVDEAARQGVLAGPAVVAKALAAPDRPAQLAAIAAAPGVEGRETLLEVLARVAAGPDRRVAIPAARAARAIAIELAEHDLPDDIAPDDARVWRDAWAALAVRADRWIEVRVLALDTSAALERAATTPGQPPASIGVALETALADRDPAFRFAAIHDVPAPVPDAMRPLLVKAIESDIDNDVARAAAQVLCFDTTTGLTPAASERAKTLGVKRCLTKR
jgi:hypothetical protein